MDKINKKRVKELITQHHVCWDVVPLQAMTKEGLHAIGYEIHLMGLHEEHHADEQPGCVQCRQVYNDLHYIAQTIIPLSDQDVEIELDPFDGALRFASSVNAPPAVRLVIEVRHRAHWDALLDVTEHHVVKQITDTLKELGVPQHRYPVW